MALKTCVWCDKDVDSMPEAIRYNSIFFANEKGNHKIICGLCLVGLVGKFVISQTDELERKWNN